MPTYTVKKLGRGQYQVVDEHGAEQFAFPTSEHEANVFIMEYKTDERFLNDATMQKVAMKYINDNRMPVSVFGDLRQFMVNSIYHMYHGDIRKLMQSQRNYREHLEKVAERNKAARRESLGVQLPLLKIVDIVNGYFERLGKTLPLSSEVPAGLVLEFNNAAA